MRNKTILIMMVLFLALGLVLTACGSKTGSGSSNATVAPGTSADGQTLMNDRCSKCHAIDRVTSAHKTADQWTTTITRMLQHGAKLSSAEETVLVAYLAKTYGP